MHQNNLNKRIIDLTVAELLELLDGRYGAKDIPHAEPKADPTATVKKVPLKKLSSVYGWGISTIYRWCRERFIPYHRVGGQYWFDLDQVDSWIMEKKVRTTDEVINDFGKRKYSRK